MRLVRLLPLVLLLMLPTGCGDDGPSTSPPAASSPDADGMVTVPLGERPFRLYVPTSYTPGQAMPLVILLHGFGSDGREQERYFGLLPHAEQRGFLYAIPEGTRDRSGKQFWNATDYCCDLNRTGVDDSGYLSSLIDLLRRDYTVGPVVLVGHSNGGFMAHRMACEHADQITAIASLAGVDWRDEQRCQPSGPVSVLQLHGTDDGSIRYGGGAYPGAEDTVAHWVARDGCDPTATTTEGAMDLLAVAGAETTVVSYDGCSGGARVQLWRLVGGSHVPALTDAWAPAVLDFLLGPA